jgi:hypothetical protein
MSVRIQLAGYADRKKFSGGGDPVWPGHKVRPDDADLQTNLGTALTFAGGAQPSALLRSAGSETRPRCG